VLLFQEMDHYSGTFLFYNSSFFGEGGVSFLLLGHEVVAEVGCNWYLCDINICSLLKKDEGDGLAPFMITHLSPSLCFMPC
jgi:hypothetical protein